MRRRDRSARKVFWQPSAGGGDLHANIKEALLRHLGGQRGHDDISLVTLSY